MRQAGVPAAYRWPQKKTVDVADNFYGPQKVTVNPGSTVTWKWTDEAADVHDVKLKSGPKHVKKFHSQPAASDYSFKRKLTVPGKYSIVCTLHEDMKMTIRVKH